MCVQYSFDKSCWFSRSTTLSPFTSASSRLGFACAALFCRRERLRSTWREMLMGVVRACMFRIPPRGPWNYDDWIKAFADRSYRCDVANYFIISIVWSTWRRYAVTALGSISYGERTTCRTGNIGDRSDMSYEHRSVAVSTSCSLIVFASSTVQWPKLPGYTCLRRAISSRKENYIGTCLLEKKALMTKDMRD